MLDIDQPLTVSGADVLAYADLEADDVVWAFPAAPRLAVADDGSPEASLLLYRRGEQGPVEGGQLTITIDLRLTPAESAAVAATAAAARAAELAAEAAVATSAATESTATESTDAYAVPEPKEEAPPTVRTPQWTDGTASVELIPGLRLEGRPSMYGVNSCALVLQLPPDRVDDVRKAWEDGFPEAVATMQVTAEAVSSGSAAETAQATMEDSGATATYSYDVSVQATRSAPLALRLQGPLRLPAAMPASRRTDITL